jgi:hypothetical protein
MAHTYWRKQTTEILFPDILWSRPQSKQGAGKLAIIGGHAHGFGAPGVAWSEALKSGIGVAKVILPDAVKKTVKQILPDAEYAPSNPSGSLSKDALAELLDISVWSDGVLIAGDLGRNSETSVLLEEFVQIYDGLLTVTHDGVDYFKSTPKLLFERKNTLVVLSLAQLQKMFINMPLITPITYSMSSLQLVEALHGLTSDFPACIAVVHNGNIFVAHGGEVVSAENTKMPWRVKTASKASVFWIQNPTKIFESVVSSLAETD